MKIKTTLPRWLACGLALFLASTLSAQSIELDPTKGWQGKMMEVGISGTNTTFISASSTCGTIEESSILFHQGMTTFGVESVQLESDFQLYSTINIAANAPTGLYDVILWPGQGACTITCQDCFEVFPPASITAVDPDSASLGNTELDVTISADFTCFTQGSSTCQATPESVRFIQSSGGSGTFKPNAVEVLDDKTLVAEVDLPTFTAVGTYDMVVGEGFPCEATCEECFEVLPEPFFEFISGTTVARGTDSTMIVEVFFADIMNCDYTNQNVIFIHLESNQRYFPTEVTMMGQRIMIDYSIPTDAPVGTYSIVIGDDLDAPCRYSCEDCFRVDPALSINPVPQENQLLVYPNPNDGQFTILSDRAFFDCGLEIYDASGRLVVQERLKRMAEYPVTLEAKGVYLLKLTTAESTTVQRIVVE
ncbi:MAG: T9SS type A sorting domain-containing protein [Bacteroidota bacterium]